MKNIIPVALLAASTLVGCNNHSTQGVSANNTRTNAHLRNVLNLPNDEKLANNIEEAMKQDRQEEFQANGGTAHGDTSMSTKSKTDDTISDTEADSIYYEEFIKPGPH